MPLSLLSAPDPLTPLQRRLLWIGALVVAATRVFALSESMWDWDEAQFASAVREYDVGRQHHPHPPGFPFYIAMAKVLRLVAPTEFAALQTLVLLCACALFPLAFFLARELRFPFWTSILAATLFVFLPNIWFYGGTAFSDIPGIAFNMAAATMLLRGCRNPRDYLLGALLLGLAAGMRPQAVVLGAAPLGVASWIQLRNSWRRVLAAAAIVAGTVILCYSGAALASASVGDYFGAIRGHKQWIQRYDSISSPTREPLHELFDNYFVRPMGAGRLGIVVSALALLGALRGLRREGPRVGLALLTWLPFALFAYISLDPHSIHRFSTAYLFLWALLAAHAVAPIGRWPLAGQIALILLMAGRYAQWTGVMLTEVRSDPSPPHAAMMWIRDHVAKGQRIWIHGSLAPFARYSLHDRDVQLTTDETVIRERARAGEYYAIEGGMRGEGNQSFVRPRGRIWDVARHRYFSATVMPVSNLWQFGAGWHDEEQHQSLSWRWMGAKGEILVPGGPGKARLRLVLMAQDRVSPEVEVELNGVVIDRFLLPPQKTAKEWIVDSRADGPNRLVLRSSAVMNPKALGLSDDARDLSFGLFGYGWQPLR